MEYNEYPRKQHISGQSFDITRPVGSAFRDFEGKLIRVNNAIGAGDSIACSKCCFNSNLLCGISKTRKDSTRGECRNYKRCDNTQVYYSEVKPVHINFMDD